MVKIRLAQTGTKNKIKFRIIAIDENKKRNGKAIEILGFYDPLVKPPVIKFDRERLNYWISVGAQMTEKVKSLTRTDTKI